MRAGTLIPTLQAAKYWPGFNHEYLISPPGVTLRYSNLGFELLGMVIERVTGMKYEDYMKKFILTPLGMSECSFNETYEVGKKLVTTYAGNFQSAQFDIRNKPGGNLYATTRGMANYIKYLLSDKESAKDRIITSSSFEEMTTPQFTNTDFFIEGKFPYGFGWMIYSLAGPGTARYKVIYHSGLVNGFSSEIFFIPVLNAGMVMMAAAPWPGDLFNKARQEAFKYLIESKTGETFDFKEQEITNSPVKVSKDFNRVEGTYTGNGVKFALYLENDKLYCKSGLLDFTLKPSTGDVFQYDMQGGLFGSDKTYLYYKRTAVGKDQIIVHGINKYGSWDLPMEKVNPYRIPEKLLAYTGKWQLVKEPMSEKWLEEIMQTNVIFDITNDDGFLEIRNGNNFTALVPVNENEAVEAGEGSTVFFTNDEIFNYGLRFNRVR